MDPEAIRTMVDEICILGGIRELGLPDQNLVAYLYQNPQVETSPSQQRRIAGIHRTVVRHLEPRGGKHKKR